MRKLSKFFLGLTVLVSFGIATPAIKADDCTVIGNLVTNCGFETGNFDGWTRTGNQGLTVVVASAAHSGNFGATIGPQGSLGFITQNLVTIPGQTYNLSFWLSNFIAGPSNFQASWNGIIVQSLTSPAAFGYTQFTFNGLIAGAASTPLQFGFRHDILFYRFDDVVVVPAGQQAVPEPATLFLLGTGLIGITTRYGRKFSVARPTASPNSSNCD